MNETKITTGFLSFFFFFQGVFLAVMILFTIFNYKIVPEITKKNSQIELLVNELNKIKHKDHDYSESKPKNFKIKNQSILITI